ncbi:MAG TPA: cyclic nucleotide-binding domain-containing protein [Solirubrobacteraceae bacterium]
MEVLRRVPLLEGVDEDELAELAERFRERLYDRGSPVVSKGSAGAGFFIIAEGEATVGTGGRATGHLSKNDFFGEVALIDGGRRSADITADTNMRCWGISKNEFRTFVKGHPDVAWAMLEVLAARLRAAERPAPVAVPARASVPAPSPEPAPASRRRWPLRK